MLRFLSSQRGMSLLEILLALAILGLIIGPVFKGLQQGLEAITAAGKSTQAVEWASATMEELKAVGEAAYEILLPVREEMFSENLPGFLLSKEAEVVDSFEFQGIRRNLVRVSVTVEWPERNGQNQVRLETIITGR